MLYREVIAVCPEIHSKHINVFSRQNVEFLGAFAKLQKVTISLLMSVRLPVYMEQLGSHRINFHEIYI